MTPPGGDQHVLRPDDPRWLAGWRAAKADDAPRGRVPASGEQHERAVEAAYPERCPEHGSGEWPARRHVLRARAILDSLREQGVVLVDLREVAAFVREVVAPAATTQAGADSLYALATALERRFGHEGGGG